MSRVLKYTLLFIEIVDVVPSNPKVDDRASIFENFFDNELPIIRVRNLWASFSQPSVGHLKLMKTFLQRLLISKSD